MTTPHDRDDHPERRASGAAGDPVAFFRDADWTAGVIGLGYVGLPLAVTAAERGLGCIGYDVDPDRVAALRSGRSHIEDVPDGALAEALDQRLEITSDADRLGAADALFVCVPSPLGRNRQPDMSYIETAATTLTSVARPGQFVALESTTYPGTTEDIVVPALTASGLVLDRDVWVAFSPERVDPGNVLGTGDIAKVVGGVSQASGDVAEAAYGRLVAAVHRVSTSRAAELTKLLENTYRAVNIALVNEMAQLAHEMDVDIWEVVDAAATKPFGFQPFYPGPGVGGHCIPLDPQYLAWRAREMRFATRFIDLAEQVNVRMPDYVVARVADELNGRGMPIFGTRVVGLGLAYKRNVADDRESPALDVLRLLERRGAVIGVHDPHVPDERIEKYGYQPVGAADIGDWALALVLTDHDAFDYEDVADRSKVVFDTRGAYHARGISRPNVVAL